MEHTSGPSITFTNDVSRLIFELVTKSGKRYTSREISNVTGISRVAVQMALMDLVNEKLIRCRPMTVSNGKGTRDKRMSAYITMTYYRY